MKAFSSARFMLFAATLFALVPLAEARDGRSSDRGRDHGDHGRGNYHRGDNHRGYGSRGRYYRGFYRPSYNYYSGYGFGYGGYGYYGRPYNSLSIGVGPAYTTSYYTNDRPVYRGEQLSESGDGSLEISVQKRLGKLGYYNGEYDGSIGPASRRAIMKYQRDNDLPTTGMIDRKLVNALDLS